MTDHLPLPADAARILRESGPAALDLDGRLHTDRHCPSLSASGPGPDPQVLLEAGGTYRDAHPVRLCPDCGPDLVHWNDVVNQILTTFDLRETSATLGARGGAIDRDYATPTWSHLPPGTLFPACCQLDLPAHPGAGATLSSSDQRRLEELITAAVHEHILSTDPYAGQARTHAVIVTTEAFLDAGEYGSGLYSQLCTQHPWAGTRTNAFGPALTVFHLPEHAAEDVAAQLPDHALVLPAHDLDEPAWKVLSAVVETQYATRDDATHHALGRDLPDLVRAARAATH